MINAKAPRMRKGKFSTIIFSKELYKRFCQEYPEYKLSWKEFKQYWMDITETIRYEGVMNPLGVKLPLYLGELKYQYLPYKYKALDRKATQEEEERINHMSLTTRGKIGTIKWERRWAVNFFKMLQFYAFEHDQKMNKLAKKYTTENPEKVRVSRAVLKPRYNK